MPGPIKLTISITTTGAVDIDCAGKKGGHIRGMALRRVRWLKDTSVDRFDLKFERYEDEEGPLSWNPDWPFLEARAQPNAATTDEDAGTVTGAEKFSARLADTGVYKYTVTAYKGANRYVLDPMIIVGR
jgi:hypothetical protein